MKKFSFRLEKVLNYRSRIAEEKLRDLINARNYATQLEMEEKRLIEEMKNAALNEGETLNAATLQLRGEYGMRLEKEIAEKRQTSREQTKVVVEKLAIYLEASKEEKVLLKLKEKKRSEYLEELLRAEQKELDDIALMARSHKFGAL
jgi:flagellar FliJ protein